jgi:HK97 gp10 family phage protein
MPLKYARSSTSAVEGLSELNDKLQELGKQLGAKALRGALMSATLPVLKEARARAPIGTVAHKTYKGRLVAPGFLARSLKRRSQVNRDGTGASVSIGVRNEAFYGTQFLELGTSKIAKRPWLVPAYQAKHREALDVFKSELKRRIDKVAAK